MKNRPDFHPAPTKIVQLMGLEPTPKYMDMNLNHARMPIPPQLQKQCSYIITSSAIFVNNYFQTFLTLYFVNSFATSFQKNFQASFLNSSANNSSAVL